MTEVDFRLVLAERGREHWWHAGMRRVTWALLGQAQGRVLDVGCGPGWELAELSAAAWGVGVDLHPHLAVARPTVRADAMRLPFPDRIFDLALALDVLEQTGVDPRLALAEVARVLRPGGRLLLRVPAHPWLSGPHDAYWGGARRYRRAEIAALIQGAGLTLRRLTYANGLLFPTAAVERLAARAGVGSGDDLRPLPTLLNGLLTSVLSAEARWLRWHDLPVGLSLMCLAQRVTGDE